LVVKKHLFLHMGPGLNAQAENHTFSSRFLDVLFWDQPHQPLKEEAFSRLTQSAQTQIAKLNKASGGPIGLITHSFSGQLALALLEKIDPKMISHCTLICPEFYFENCFANLLQRLVTRPNTSVDFKSEVKEYLKRLPNLTAVEKFKLGFEIVIKDKEFFKSYWYDEADFLAYVEATKNNSPLDFDSFLNISQDLLTHPNPLQRSSFNGPVQIIMGQQDPLIHLKSELKAWKTVFPQAEIKVLDRCGHFAHFEKKTLFI
jgi:pimeloyl-ACP methyl ester carboxylesterase